MGCPNVGGGCEVEGEGVCKFSKLLLGPSASAIFWAHFYAHGERLQFDSRKTIYNVMVAVKSWVTLAITGHPLDQILGLSGYHDTPGSHCN